MTPVDDAKKILDGFTFDRKTYVDIKDSFGRVLAGDIISKIKVPPYDRAEKDGYAIMDQNPDQRTFELIGETLAGDEREVIIKSGECCWVATGAKIPVGTNLVIPVEDTEECSDDVGIRIKVCESRVELNISRKGCDIERGATVLEEGCLLNERNIGILASLGIRNVRVYDTPNVAIISTGDELTQINDVNSLTLSAIVKQSGCSPFFIGTVSDDSGDIKKKLDEALKYDIILTSGGVSVGKKDLMPEVVFGMGEILFHGVRMRPGMPMLAGKIDEKPILCMPGNVTSCLVCANVFLLPMLRYMTHLPFIREIRSARLSEEVTSEYGMRRYLPVKLAGDVAYPTFNGSGLITSIAYADGFVVIREDETLTEGEVDVWVF
ncbi:MAG: molybdopterin molybdotransferase MoeA [ANME-2 cluster archaeon]|nr:molybdopterin molybdotransferase MoeA [ANME-2 cluster archaeon]MBC2707705.1 molybdopterin molybdotransferase MoeA [ANME-2 cluster archaeon]MBC2763029.1 molybdopterin molybdotransferase MoeA [ANME-2 cluster archaeon]